MDLWAVVPVKERASAKERLAPMLRPEMRQALALAMLEDVLAALTATPGHRRALGRDRRSRGRPIGGGATARG